MIAIPTTTQAMKPSWLAAYNQGPRADLKLVNERQSRHLVKAAEFL